MTLETAKRISEKGDFQGLEITTNDEYMLLNKEAEAIIRGGMTICEEKGDGTRKYTWIKVKPTQTDDESSIEQAMKNHQRRKRPRPKPVKREEAIKPEDNKVTIPQSETSPSPQIVESDQKEYKPLSRLIMYLKTNFDKFVEKMDEFADE